MERPLSPRLVGTGGPVDGGIYELADEISIGRDAVNGLAIDDWTVSRRHCSIRRLAPDRFEICDLGSHNGTRVNGLPVTERVLADGDEIRIGECRFLFLLTESDEGSSLVSIESDRDGPDTLTLHRFRREDGLLPLEPSPGELAAGSRPSGSLAVLIRIATSVQSVRRAQEMARQVLERIYEVIPAGCGTVLLFEGTRDEPAMVYSCDREGGTKPVVRAYSEIVARARREGVAILARGPERAGSKHVLAAPIVGLERTVGVIYLEAGDRASPFDNEHLQLVTAIGGVVGMPFENALRLEWLEAENRRLLEAIDMEHDMVGASRCMQEVFQRVSRVAPTDATILIRGESGTGKELVARAIHRNSKRVPHAFIAINCAALTETLLESELFGHERGAFTGAIVQKRGKLEIADRGTLFLDEVGELPPAFQTKLLRVLQEREFERVGGNRPIRVDVRLIAATNRDLEAAIAANAFRKDLYYRLNVVSLTMPPLRERSEDIPLLARHFAAKHGKRAGRRVVGISPEALACLEDYDWPGNVRELENAIERAVVLGSADLIVPEDLPEAVLEAAPALELAEGYHLAVRKAKKKAILAALNQAAGNYTEAAALLGVHPNYLHRLVRNLNLRAEIRKTFGD